MATAADFQRAFQVDLPIGEVISKNLEQGMAMQERKRAKEEERAFQALQTESKIFKDASNLGSTGVRNIDEYVNNNIAATKNEIQETQKKLNRGLTAMEIQSIADKRLAELPRVVSDYKAFEGQMDDALKEMQKTSSFVNTGLLKQDMIDVMLGQDAEGKPTFDRDEGMKYLMEVAKSPELQTHYADPTAVADKVGKEVIERFKPAKIDVTTTQGAKAGIKTYHNLVPDITRIDKSGKNVELNTEPLKIGKEEVEALTPEAYQAYTSIPAAITEINLIKRDLRKKYKDFDSSVSEEDANRIAANLSLKKHWKGIGNLKPVEVDRSEADRMEAERRYAESLALRRQSVDIAKENLRLRKGEESQNYLDLVNGALAGVPAAVEQFAKDSDGRVILDIPKGKPYMLNGQPVSLRLGKNEKGKDVFIAIAGEDNNGVVTPYPSSIPQEVPNDDARNLVLFKARGLGDAEIGIGKINIPPSPKPATLGELRKTVGYFEGTVPPTKATAPVAKPAAKASVNVPLSNSGKEYLNKISQIGLSESDDDSGL